MSNYKKVVEVTSTGMVCAGVIHISSGRCVGQEFFQGFLSATPERLEKRFKKAHAWADGRIAVCERQEVSDVL